MPAGVVAVVLTHRRPRLATQAVRHLIEHDRFAPNEILVVVNGEGGLDDPALQRQVNLVVLPTNTGPAGGFAAGLRAAARTDAQWFYLCEDDVGLLSLPAGRIPEMLEAVRVLLPEVGSRVGAVVAYGRVLDRRGHTEAYLPEVTPALQPVDVAAWGASLVHRAVVEAGVLPDESWFFGYEDFDFFLRLRAAGFAVVVDAATGRAVAGHMTAAGRELLQAEARPTDAAEGWRAYYVARNFFLLLRAHGDWRWLVWHLLFSVRRMQLARSPQERRATLRGLAHGWVGRRGVHPDYTRPLGELPPQDRNGQERSAGR